MEVLLYTILTLCVLGVLAAIVLYFVARKFRVEEDPRIDVVEKMLPGVNCGGCGFAGCRGMADALVRREDISELFCPVGGADVMKQCAEYLGKTAPEKEAQTATVRCGGTCAKRPRTNRFDGAQSCAVAASLYVGETAAPTAVWLRRLRVVVRLRSVVDGSRDGASGGRRRQMYGLRRLCQDLPERDHRAGASGGPNTVPFMCRASQRTRGPW